MTAWSIDRLPRPRRIDWVHATSDLTVGYLNGSCIGRIDRVRDGFVPVNAHGEPLGRLDDLKQAKAALASKRSRLAPHGSGAPLERVAFAVATVTGAVSILFTVAVGPLAGF